MAAPGRRPAIDLSHVREVLEVANSILQCHRDEHLAKKTLILQGFLEMSQRYPERDYWASTHHALTELTAAIHLHLNAELHAVNALFERFSNATAGQATAAEL